MTMTKRDEDTGMKAAVLSLCEFTGNMVRPWAEAGHECFCVDIRQERRGDEVIGEGVIHYIEADLFDWLPPLRKYVVSFAFPECTNLAVSGARWFAGKGLNGLAKGIGLVERCISILEWTEAPWMLENPVGTLSTYWREPDYIFQPWMYGHLEQKATCLWTGGGFWMPKEECLSKPENVAPLVWRMPPSEDRGRKRSVTSEKFARAVFKANFELAEKMRMPE